jgi:hypothetical protein
MAFIITPETRVGEMLAAYPETEAVLVKLAPAFAKLSNPLLRKTIAKVTTLAQAAKIGGVPFRDLIDRLRQVVGQPLMSDYSADMPETQAAPQHAPDWACAARAQRHIDADALLQRGGQPLESVQRALAEMQSGEVLSVSSGFYPAPLIDVLRKAGHNVFCQSTERQSVTYVRRS